MLIKYFELEKLNNLKPNIHLIYGKNEGIKEEIIKKVYLKNFRGELIKYDEQEILNNNDNFVSHLINKSLFENQKVIIISRATEKLYNAIKDIFDKEIPEISIIIKSLNLDKKSKLRNFFEKEKRLICTPVYEDDNRSLNYILNSFLKDNRLSLSQEIKNILIERANGDRINLKNELSK